LYTVEAKVDVRALEGEGGKSLPAELAASGVILQGGKVAFYPRFPCYEGGGSTGEDRCDHALSILESQARDAGYWVVPWRSLDARDVHGSAKKAGIRYLFEIDQFRVRGPLEKAWKLEKFAFRSRQKGSEDQSYVVDDKDADSVKERCTNLFSPQLAAYEAPLTAALQARLLAIDEERVLWTYKRSIAESDAPPLSFSRYYEVDGVDNRRPFFQNLAIGLAGASAASFVGALATTRAPRALPWTFFTLGVGFGGAAGYSFYRSRQYDPPKKQAAGAIICDEKLALSSDPWAATPEPDGEITLADDSGGDPPSLEDRRETLSARLLSEFVGAIGPLERKAWANPDGESTAKEDGEKDSGQTGEETKAAKWPWLPAGTECKIIHSGPPGCPMQLICGATWVQCVTMETPYALPPSAPSTEKPKASQNSSASPVNAMPAVVPDIPSPAPPASAQSTPQAQNPPVTTPAETGSTSSADVAKSSASTPAPVSPAPTPAAPQSPPAATPAAPPTSAPSSSMAESVPKPSVPAPEKSPDPAAN
jgi:hypothetical protein